MNFTTQHQQIALTYLSGIGSRRARILIAHFNDLEEFFTEKKLNLSKIPGIPSNFISFKQRMDALMAADQTLDRLAAMGGSTVFFTDTNYPRRLKQCDDAPLLLYSKGNINWNPEKIVAIVGTRNASEYGKQLTEEIVQGLHDFHVTIVSGMAYGIDICAHQAAIRYDLPTLGVLGHGIDLMYPATHRKTAEKMIQTGGLVSEFYPGLKPDPGHFPMRNRIVAGLCDATIVIESGEKGGSLITANLANDYHRDVFAFPGDVSRTYSKGCLKLIQENKAHLLTGSGDFLKYMGWNTIKKPTANQRQLFHDLNAKEEKIVAAMKTKTELSLDTIGYLSSMPISEVSSELLGLEFKGIVKSLPGKRFSLI